MSNNPIQPAPDSFDDKLRQALSVINAQNSDGDSWISSLDISRSLLGEYGLHVHWRTVDKILSERKDLVGRRKRKKRWEYALLTAGQKLVSAPEAAVIRVDPSEAVQAVVSLHDTLSSLIGDIRICDPYLDRVTIEHLDACPLPSRVMLLTSRVRDSGRLRRTLAAAQTVGHNIEIRVDAADDLHDRYVIDDGSMLILGASLNGFGRRQSFVVKAGEDIRGLVLADFESRWAAANPWP